MIRRDGTMVAGLRKLGKERSGSAILMLALMTPVVMMLLSIGVDYARALAMRQKLQIAADAATLAVAKRSALDASATASELKAFGAEFLSAQIDGDYNILTFEVDPETSSVALALSGTISGLLTRFFKVDNLDYSVASSAQYGRVTVEVALVLDTSRSISDEELQDVKTAANALVDELLPTEPSALNTQTLISIVPFAGAVRLPVSERGQWWIDGNDGGASNHFDHINPVFHSDVGEPNPWRPTRMELFDQVTDHEWGGCLEHPKSPADVEDIEPKSYDPETWFLPYFAFDIPDLGAKGKAKKKKSDHNDWLDDNVGVCAPPPTDDDFLANVDATCKYGSPQNKVSSNGRIGTREGEALQLGPNYYCSVAPMQPLTNDRTALDSTINALVNDHVNVTDLTMGVMWGWRALSPGAPLEQSDGDPSDQRLKFMIVMSDGANAAPHADGKNYGGWGFPSDGRLDPLLTPGSSSDEVNGAMDEHTAQACENAKRYGITMVTVNFGTNEDGIDLLGNCASQPEYFFEGRG